MEAKVKMLSEVTVLKRGFNRQTEPEMYAPHIGITVAEYKLWQKQLRAIQTQLEDDYIFADREYMNELDAQYPGMEMCKFAKQWINENRNF